MNSRIFLNKIVVYPPLGKCEVEFRKGLNVVISKDVKGTKKGTNVRNSVGKTTFVNLIDFLLGKHSFLKIRKINVMELFEDKNLISEVIFGERKYTILRSFLEEDKIEIYNDWVLDLIKANANLEKKRVTHEEYVKWLSDCIYGNNIKKYITHRSLMSFLIRDQAHGFSKYDSGIKEEKGAQRNKRLDYVLGLMNEEREILEGEIFQSTKKKKKLSDEKNILKKYFEMVTETSLVDLNKQKRENDKLILKLEKSMKEEAAIENKEIMLSAISEKISETSSKIAHIESDIGVLSLKIEEYNLAINDIDNEVYKLENIQLGINLFTSLSFSRCPVYSGELKSKESICDFIKQLGDSKDFQPMIKAREKIINFERKDIESAIKKVLKLVAELKKKRNSLQEKLSLLELEKDEICQELSDNSEIKSRINELQLKNTYIMKELQNFAHVKKLSGDISNINQEINEKRELLLKLKGNMAFELDEIYNFIVSFLTDETRVGQINNINYAPSILYPNGTIDNGAAMGNVAIIAFDIALLELSLKNESVSRVLPKFLVHDSPKNHDIQLEIYERIFDYIILLEEKYPGTEFQYIITTLDISKNVVAEAEKYLKLVLDNSGDGGRLFGCQVDFN